MTIILFSTQAIGTRPTAMIRSWSPAGPMAEDVKAAFSKETESRIINRQTMQTAIEDLFYLCCLSKESSWDYASWIVDSQFLSKLVSLDFTEVDTRQLTLLT